MIELSREQMLAVNHGIIANESWSVAPLPTGRFPIPSWALDLRVDFMPGYANRPRVLVLTNGTEFDGDWRWSYDGRLYSAELDGRLQWYAAGKAVLTETAVFKKFNTDRYPFGEWVPSGEFEWMTPKTEGFGGRHIQIKMIDGRDVTLRGAWHVSAPPGFVEINTYDHTRAGAWERKNAKSMRARGLDSRWPLTGTFGLAIRDELFLRLLSHFAPHLRAASVKYHGLESLEPREVGKPPKGMVVENQDLSDD